MEAARHPKWFAALALGSLTLIGTGCPDEEIAPFNYCDTEDTEGSTPPDGMWNPEDEEVWIDPGGPGLECLVPADPPEHTSGSDDGPCADNPCIEVSEEIPDTIVAHHCQITAVHAVHLRTGELFLMHGERDQRVWRIGGEPSEVSWHPIPYRSNWQLRLDVPSQVFCAVRGA